ncbi:MAG: lamin tail domain-containing protein [Chloroflexota bacterium]
MWVAIAFFIFINEVMPAPSNAPEWVELYNPGPDPIDISGWYLDDDTVGGTQIIIPADTVIAPASLHVVTLSSAILNNTGDAITLYHITGQLIDRIDFGAMKNTESLSRMPDGGTIIIKTPPSPGQRNNISVSPTPLPPTATPSIVITADTTATTLVVTPTAPILLTDTPSETRTMLLTNTPQPSKTLSPTMTESPTWTPSPSRTPSETRSPSPTKTPSETRTPSPSRTPSETRTPSPSKTPSKTRTPSPSKTPSNTPLVASTRTASLTRTASPTKTSSRTRTPRPSKTPRLTHTPKSTRTPSLTKTPRPTRTPLQGVTTRGMQSSNQPPATTPIIDITGQAHAPQLIVCPPPPSTLDHWALTANGHHITLPNSRACVIVDLPADPPPHWQLANPHGLVVASIDVFARYCAHDMSNCQPSPTTAQQVFRVEYQRPQMTPIRATATPHPTDTAEIAPIQTKHNHAPSAAPSTVPLGMLLMLGGWIALKLLARPAPDVLYSEADEDAASSADSLSSESRKV